VRRRSNGDRSGLSRHQPDAVHPLLAKERFSALPEQMQRRSGAVHDMSGQRIIGENVIQRRFAGFVDAIGCVLEIFCGQSRCACGAK
jgi:hypothetical protein